MLKSIKKFLIFFKPKFLYKYQIGKIYKNSPYKYQNIRVSEILENMKKNNKIEYYYIEGMDRIRIRDKYLIGYKYRKLIKNVLTIIIIGIVVISIELIILVILSNISNYLDV